MSWNDFLQFSAKTAKDKADLLVLLLINLQHFLLACEGWGGLRRRVVFFIESEIYLHGILGAANVPGFDT